MENVPGENMQQDTAAPAPAPAPVAEEAKKGAAYGSIIGIVIIVAVLVAGAFYVWGERLNEQQPQVPENGVRGEMLPDGSYPSVEGSLDVESGENGPQPR
ncbi:MAG TPA: hypothetical protein VGE48_00765 [Candidatus Paceibacterota bacterium]